MANLLEQILKFQYYRLVFLQSLHYRISDVNSRDTRYFDNPSSEFLVVRPYFYKLVVNITRSSRNGTFRSRANSPLLHFSRDAPFTSLTLRFIITPRSVSLSGSYVCCGSSFQFYFYTRMDLFPAVTAFIGPCTDCKFISATSTRWASGFFFSRVFPRVAFLERLFPSLR